MSQKIAQPPSPQPPQKKTRVCPLDDNLIFRWSRMLTAMQSLLVHGHEHPGLSENQATNYKGIIHSLLTSAGIYL